MKEEYYNEIETEDFRVACLAATADGAFRLHISDKSGSPMRAYILLDETEAESLVRAMLDSIMRWPGRWAPKLEGQESIRALWTELRLAAVEEFPDIQRQATASQEKEEP